MIDLFHEMNVCKPPLFVAHNLRNLPPLINNVDSLHVMAEVNTLKQQISSLVESQKELLTYVKNNGNNQRNVSDDIATVVDDSKHDSKTDFSSIESQLPDDQAQGE